MSTLYFVLNGFVNGDEGELAQMAGSGDKCPDGWYWLDGVSPDGTGPYASRNAAKVEADKYDALMAFSTKATEIIDAATEALCNLRQKVKAAGYDDLATAIETAEREIDLCAAGIEDSLIA